MRTLLALAGITVASLHAEIIDRIAVSVENQVITTSEVDLQLRLTALLNNEAPQFTAQARRDAADRLVEQLLIRREMNAPGNAMQPAEAATVDPAIEKMLRARYPTEEAYKAALDKYNLKDSDVRRQLEWMTRLSRFVDVRFRPGVQVPEDEAREYYQHVWVPDWQLRNRGTPPGFDDIRESMVQDLMSERANAALERWIGQVRTQTRIIYHKEAFQ